MGEQSNDETTLAQERGAPEQATVAMSPEEARARVELARAEEVLRIEDEAKSAAREQRRAELAEKARGQEKASLQVRDLVQERKDLDDEPRRFQDYLLRKQRELNERLSKARAVAAEAVAAQEELVRDFVPEELRRRRGEREAGRNEARAACRSVEEDVRSLGIQLEQLRVAGADALAIKKAEGRLTDSLLSLRALQRKADEAQAEYDRADREFRAALDAAMA